LGDFTRIEDFTW